jgi:hypothetical protein
MKEQNKINMRQLFMGLQSSMVATLQNLRSNIDHEPTKGQGSELVWIQFFKDYMPERYSVANAKIVDYHGHTSDQIDVVIYDRQYTPFVLNNNGIKYIPAESVYAVFETKQDINTNHIRYAGKKIESVRKLDRTIAPAIDIGIVKTTAPLFRILGGLLCLDNCWASTIEKNKSFKEGIQKSTENKFIDIGCVLNDKSFVAEIDSTDHLNPKVHLHYSAEKETLIFFFLKLVTALQKLGTVRPIDLNKYIDQLKSQ